MTRILFLGDVHVGSSYAVFPEYYQNPETGVEVSANKVQKQLLRFWYKLAEKHASKDSPPDYLILMGDLIDGPQRRENYHTLVLPNIEEQITVFLSLLEAWYAKNIIVVRGTPYHVTIEGLHCEEYIARHLPNVKHLSRWSSERASQVDVRLHFKESKVKLHAKHHIGVSQIPHYQFTPLARDVWKLFVEDVNFHMNKGWNLVVRAHAHYYRLLQIGLRARAFITPCWQLPTEYAKNRGHDTASIGMVGVELEKDGQMIMIEELDEFTFAPHWVEVDG
jgi:hypothetical protein